MGAAIELESVSKHFRLYHDKPKALKEWALRRGKQTREEFWALRDVEFDVTQGETMGLLGHNGSGKSTLLKCIAGILRPTTGRVRRFGRTAALLELGAGFHPDLTGRENVFLNGSILGLTKTEIRRIFDEIVAFAEIEPFIDNQVKHYSSGMQARLGFAVAVHVDPEVLLVDEVLAVGDESFQRKCLDRIHRFQAEGRTIFLVTHQSDLVRQTCGRAVVLSKGQVVHLGSPNTAIAALRGSLLARDAEFAADAHEAPLGIVHITGVDVRYPDPGRRHVKPGEGLAIELTFEALQPTDDVIAAIEVHDQTGNLMLATSTKTLDVDLGQIQGTRRVVFDFASVPLLDGIYRLTLTLHHDSGRVFDSRGALDSFEVVSTGTARGRVSIPVRAIVEPS